MPARKEVASYLHGRGAHYMFVAKGNHPGMFEILTEWAGREIARPADHVCEPGRPAHGRLEKQEVRVSTGPLHMIAFPWAGQVFAAGRTVRQYGCARAGRPATVGRPSVEIVVGITSHTPMTADAERLLALNRGHWTIEAMHRVLDEPAGWNEDHSRTGSGRGPENMHRVLDEPAGCLEKTCPAQALRHPRDPGARRSRRADAPQAGPEPEADARLSAADSQSPQARARLSPEPLRIPAFGPAPGRGRRRDSSRIPA